MALAAFGGGPPKFDLVGPTVDDDIRRTITRYGALAVKDAVKLQTKAKRGRKPVADWHELRSVMDADAADWLAGGDPFKSRSNYSIAKEFADRNPGHNHPATMKRIGRKLKKRELFALMTAEQTSREGHPFEVHLRTLAALGKVHGHPLWQSELERAKSDIADYEAKTGTPPPAHLSMKEVAETAQNALLQLNALAVPAKPGKGLGLFSHYLKPSGVAD